MGAQPRVTVYWYSQTGQLLESVSAVTDPLEKAGWDIRRVEIRPREPFPFPWPLRRFFGVFPACVDPDGAPGITARPPVADDDDADLVVFAFPVWYLAPALPMRALVGAEPKAFDGRAVVGLVACRNMWYSAAVEVQRLLQAAGGRYVGTIAAVDTASAGVTFVTTLRWLLAGKREASWGFPRAGVGRDELDRLMLLGERIAHLAPAQSHLATEPAGLAPAQSHLATEQAEPASGTACEEALADRIRAVLAAHDAAPVHYPLAAADLLAGKVFRVWGRVIRAAGRRGQARRTVLTSVFVLWLSGAILAGLPAVVVARVLFKAGFDAAVARRLAPVLAHLSEVRR
ncbi:hypothetical protein [Streptomyces sp. HUAS TT20]|uniref:hypothetical protein n=1 Tax=Streptomyces sp. HUAS TT20 TaxID=3447509 RepID=UPI0021DB561E|nr:hypothetical protein [Streptomyces sp. HUAS 15-9]UXY32349.1 hypothetical protein N8I87_41560 [Streptomyces sp. HUAS 15-9]